ncbi:MFS transporter [Piscinibacter koreensis]|uniref:MFS transporter n=1 Tax=Piscinibacter koreensis TaxID=2742824 RepID=A0A7Y6TWW8_9BURK|nr:MFS transporter [Schlegelella koreensis]NUZ06589.1 MFS transporter [Schlegelella koreensis]
MRAALGALVPRCPESRPVTADVDEPSRGLRAATWALRAQFFVTGGLFATWGVHVPNVKAHYGLGEHALALAMMASGVGSVVALLYAGRVLARHPPRRVVPLLGIVCTLAIGSLLLPGRYAWLLVLMLAYGVAGALFDVAVNDEASTIEQRAGRPLMSGFHAMFSLGGMAGAGAWSVLASAGVSPVEHLAGAAVFLAGVAMGASTFMLRQQRHGASAGSASLSLPRGPLLLLGLLAAMGLIGEGALYDWSVLYVRQELAAPSATASLAYASFSGAMAAGRFGGDWVRARMTPAALVRASGALAAIGMGLALALPHPWAAIASFGLVGLGFSNVVPVLFSAAARVPGVAPAHGIAAVSSVGYFGMMVGPPVIGFIAQASSLTTGLLVVVAFAGIVAGFARRALGAR